MDVGTIMDNSDCTASYSRCLQTAQKQNKRWRRWLKKPVRGIRTVQNHPDFHWRVWRCGLDIDFTFACEAEMLIFQLGCVNSSRVHTPLSAAGRGVLFLLLFSLCVIAPTFPFLHLANVKKWLRLWSGQTTLFIFFTGSVMGQVLPLVTRQGDRIAMLAVYVRLLPDRRRLFMAFPRWFREDGGRRTAGTHRDPRWVIEQLVFGQVVQMPEAPNIAVKLFLALEWMCILMLTASAGLRHQFSGGCERCRKPDGGNIRAGIAGGADSSSVLPIGVRKNWRACWLMSTKPARWASA